MRSFYVYLSLFLLSALLPFDAYAKCGSLRGKTTTLQGFKDLIKNPDCNIRSVGDLLARVPPRSMQFYSLFFRSRSLQGPHEVDYLNPRVLVHGGTKRVPTIFTFNGDPAQPGYRSLELTEIHEETPDNVFRYYEISFPFDDAVADSKTWSEVQAQIQVSAANPRRCTACHGTPARAIFPGYPVWEGSFPSVDRGHLPEEMAGLKQYIDKVRGPLTSRYKSLVEVPHTGVQPTEIGNMMDKLSFANLITNIRLGSANAIRDSWLIQKTPDYQKFRYALTASLSECGPMTDLVPRPLLEDLLKNVDVKFKLRQRWPTEKQEAMYQTIFKSADDLTLLGNYLAPNGAPDPYAILKSNMRDRVGRDPLFEMLQLDTVDKQGLRRGDLVIADLRLLMEGRGLDIKSWFMDLTQPTYRLYYGTGNNVSLAKSIAASDPTFDSELKMRFAYRDSGESTNTQNDYAQKSSDSDNSRLRCERLKALSLQALSNYRAPRLHVAPAFTKPADASYPQVFKNVCATCHNTLGTALCVEIPFQSPFLMNEWLSHPGNAAKIQARVLAPDEGERMPPTRPLSEDELNSILRYIGQH